MTNLERQQLFDDWAVDETRAACDDVQMQYQQISACAGMFVFSRLQKEKE